MRYIAIQIDVEIRNRAINARGQREVSARTAAFGLRTVWVNTLDARGRVAQPFALHQIISAPRSHTTPARPLGVTILNLGCPVLDAFQGRGSWFSFLCGHKSHPPVFRFTPNSNTD